MRRRKRGRKEVGEMGDKTRGKGLFILPKKEIREQGRGDKKI